jgi:hypothetical protein
VWIGVVGSYEMKIIRVFLGFIWANADDDALKANH